MARGTKPEKGNKYFNTKSNGGYSSCIVGSPTESGLTVLANCVGWASSCFNEAENQNKEVVPLNCNAENFIERAIAYGYSVYAEPMVGGIMVWRKGATLSGSDGAGHVAYVYDKPSDTQVKTSESGYGSSAFWTSTRNKGNGNWGSGTNYYYRGCIAPKGYTPTPTPTPVTQKFNIGDKVVVNGTLYTSSTGSKAGKTVNNVVTNVTRYNSGSKHPYNTTGDLGWVDEASLTSYVEPVSDEIKVGDIVVPTKLVDYKGTHLIQYDNQYEVSQIDSRGYLLRAIRGNERPIWAVLPKENIKKV